MCKKQQKVFEIWFRQIQRENLDSTLKGLSTLKKIEQICICGHKRKSHMYNGCCVHKDIGGKMCLCKEFEINLEGLNSSQP